MRIWQNLPFLSPCFPTTNLKAVSKSETANNKTMTNKVHIYNTGPNLSATALSYQLVLAFQLTPKANASTNCYCSSCHKDQKETEQLSGVSQACWHTLIRYCPSPGASSRKQLFCSICFQDRRQQEMWKEIVSQKTF